MAAGESLESEENMTNNNSSVSVSKMSPGTSVITRASRDSQNGIMEEVVEQVVEEGQHIVLEQGQHVVMVEGDMGQQQLVITDANSGIIQLGNGQQFVMKSEPEDLSLVSGSTGGRGIDMEAGAQAIQASAAAAVQNVIRSLKEPVKQNSVLSSLLPDQLPQSQLNSPVVKSDPHSIVFVDTGDSASDNELSLNGATPTKRPRSSTSDIPRLQIAKQYTPFGFHCILEAPTAQWVRKEEDRCTYLNKGQFYGLTLEYRPNQTEPFPGDVKQVKSVVMLVFRDAKNPDDEINAWEFWHQRQPTSKQRIIDAETNNMTEQCGITQIEDLAYNAIAVYWSPLEKPAFISCAIQCLSTDFSLQKGVKGLPMHLQVDTYCNNQGEYRDLVHRAYCQVKVFCDKGAERKFRQEERRAARKVAVGGQRVLEMYHQCQDRSEFYSMVDLSKSPVLYSPQPGTTSQSSIPGLQQPAIAGGGGGGSGQGASSSSSGSVSILKTNNVTEPRRKVVPPPDTRMVVFVRQENEEIYTPLHLTPPTVPGLARAIESKYNVSASAIRYLYRRNKKGITAKLDDDLLKFYCNEDTFLMQVTAIELEVMEGQDSIMYDITLCEI